jgi:hypothetical protein
VEPLCNDPLVTRNKETRTKKEEEMEKERIVNSECS